MLLLTSVLPTAACAGPLWPMGEQVADGHRQVVVGVHQPRGARHDSVPVRVGVVGEGDAVPILEANQPRHRVRTRAVHADLAVVIHRHERERRIDHRVHDGDAELVDRVDGFPVRPRRAAERVHAQLEAGAPDRVHVHDVSQILDVRQDEVLLVRARRLDGGRERHPLHAGVAGPQQLVGPVLHPLGHVEVGRSTVGRVVLEAAVLRRVVRGRDHDPVREVRPPAPVVRENGPRDDRRGRDAAVALDDGLDPVRRQHFQGGALRRLGQGMRVLSHVERTVDPVAAAIVADGLGDGGDVGLGERASER